MPYILALDQGTTSSRSILFRHDGSIAACAQKEFPQIFPSAPSTTTNALVEHNPSDIWNTQLHTARRVIGGARVSPTEIPAIGIPNQRKTPLLWARKPGQPLQTAIVWQDRR